MNNQANKRGGPSRVRQSLLSVEQLEDRMAPAILGLLSKSQTFVHNGDSVGGAVPSVGFGPPYHSWVDVNTSVFRTVNSPPFTLTAHFTGQLDVKILPEAGEMMGGMVNVGIEAGSGFGPAETVKASIALNGEELLSNPTTDEYGYTSYSSRYPGGTAMRLPIGTTLRWRVSADAQVSTETSEQIRLWMVLGARVFIDDADPDIALKSAKIENNHNIKVNYEVSGESIYQSIKAKAYLSADDVFDEDDKQHLVAEKEITDPKLGKIGKRTYTFTPNESMEIAKDRRFIIFEVDADNQIEEFDESNNVLALRLPDVIVGKTTSLNPKQVVFNYEVKNGTLPKPLAVQVYRSADESFGEDDIPVLAEPLQLNGKWRKEGDHRYTIKLSKPLRTDPKHKYVLVVVDPKYELLEGDKENNVGKFRKQLLGVVTHGLVLFAGPDNSMPEWVPQVAAKLTDYDAAISFDWAYSSGQAAPRMTVAAGRLLADEIKAWAQQNATLDSGDVVDLHLIGHSRGSVVISQAFANLAARDPLDTPQLSGGYFRMTMLDPHPANNAYTRFQVSTPTDPGPSLLLLDQYWRFQGKTLDPMVFIPKNVQEADLFYQHTEADQMSGEEHQLNLWGLQAVHKHSAATRLSVTNLTAPGIGHSEVVTEFEKRGDGLWS